MYKMLREIEWRILKIENDLKKNINDEKECGFDINDFKIHERTIYNTIINTRNKLKKEYLNFISTLESYEKNPMYYSDLFHSQALSVENHIFNTLSVYYTQDEANEVILERMKFIQKQLDVAEEEIQKCMKEYDTKETIEDKRKLALYSMIHYNQYSNMLKDLKKVYENNELM